MFNIRQANFKSAHLLNKMALIQFQSNRTVFEALFDCNSTVNLKLQRNQALKTFCDLQS